MRRTDNTGSAGTTSIIDIITIILLIALLIMTAFVAMGCSIDVSRVFRGNDYPDKLYSTDEDDVTLYVFRYHDKFIETEHYYEINMPTTREISDGEFVRVLANVRFLDGGEAGYTHMPEIRKIKSIETVSIDDLDLPTITESQYGLLSIGDYADGDYLFTARGMAAVLKDGEWLYEYDNTYVDRDNNTRIYYRSGLDVKEILARVAQGEVLSEDLFVIPMKG